MEHGNFTIITGDATLPHDDNASIILIPHICNNIGAWSEGFVVAINNCFGYTPMAEYQNAIEGKGLISLDSVDTPLGLGDVQFVLVKETITPQDAFSQKTEVLQHGFSQKTFIVNMIAQEGTSSDVDDPPIRYDALTLAMAKMVEIASERQIDEEWGTISIHCPKFGCGLGGGSWDVIKGLIENIWVRRDFDVTVYEFQSPKIG